MKDDRALASTAGDCAMGGEGALRDTAGVNAQTDELPRFATRLGIHRASYQGPPRTSVPHYDLTPYERHRAIALGAIACSREEIVAIVRRTRWLRRERNAAAARSRRG